MVTLLIILLSLLICGGIIIANRAIYFDHGDPQIRILIPIAGFVVAIIAAFIQPFSIQRVDAGSVGLKVNLTGDDRGVSKYTYETGFVFVNTWTEQFFEFATYQQHAAYDPKGVILKGGLQCTIKPTFNYSVIPGNAGDMLLNLRHTLKEIEEGWLYTAVASSIQDDSNTKRDEFAEFIRRELPKITGGLKHIEDKVGEIERDHKELDGAMQGIRSELNSLDRRILLIEERAKK